MENNDEPLMLDNKQVISLVWTEEALHHQYVKVRPLYGTFLFLKQPNRTKKRNWRPIPVPKKRKCKKMRRLSH